MATLPVTRASRRLHGSVIASGDVSALATPGVALATAATGNFTSDVLDRGDLVGPGAVVITSAIGATPTVTLALQCSMDGVNYFNVAYALGGTPETVTVAALTITTAVTATYLLRPNHAWRYLRAVASANTNVTLTITAYAAA